MGKVIYNFIIYLFLLHFRLIVCMTGCKTPPKMRVAAVITAILQSKSGVTAVKAQNAIGIIQKRIRTTLFIGIRYGRSRSGCYLKKKKKYVKRLVSKYALQ